MTTTGGGTRKERKSQKNGAVVAALPPGRVPPHNDDAEQSLLGGVLFDPQAPLAALAGICSAPDFYRTTHRKVWEAMLSLFEDGIAIDRVSLGDRLEARGDLDNAGGRDYVDLLDKCPPISGNLAYYAKIVHQKARARRLIETASAIAMLGYEQHGDVATFLAESEARIRSVVSDEPAAGKLSLPALAIKLSRDMLLRPPPARKVLLHEASTRRPIFLRGKVGLFAAAGGTGKSSAFGQLAISLATGLTWFGPGGWAPVGTMRVLLLAGEDDEEELSRRLFFSAKDIGAVSDEALELVARNVVAIPLAGRGCALTMDDSFSNTTLLPETAFAVAVRDHVRDVAAQGRPYGIILIDPLSRFAGFDVEKDNAAATRWVQVVETLTAPECGQPAVMAAHHTKKRNGDDHESAAVELIRGASALKDGVRWAAVLEQQKRSKDGPDLLTLRIVKANGVPPQLMPLVLCRDEANEGALRLATNAEIATNDKLLEVVKTKKEMIDDVRTHVVSVMQPGRAYSRNDLVRLSGRRRLLVLDAVNQLLTEGGLDEPRRGVLRVVNQLDLGTGNHPGNHSSSAARFPGSGGSGPLPFPALRPEGAGNQRTPEAAGVQKAASEERDEHRNREPGTI
jgi:hypothetical protein